MNSFCIQRNALSCRRGGGSLGIGPRLSTTKRGSIPTTGSGEDSATQDESMDGEEQPN